jgi:hypothetical protein
MMPHEKAAAVGRVTGAFFCSVAHVVFTARFGDASNGIERPVRHGESARKQRHSERQWRAYGRLAHLVVVHVGAADAHALDVDSDVTAASIG